MDNFFENHPILLYLGVILLLSLGMYSGILPLLITVVAAVTAIIWVAVLVAALLVCAGYVVFMVLGEVLRYSKTKE